MNTKYILFLIFLFSTILLPAEIKVASVLGDNMVLQRNSEVKLWGKAKSSERLTVKVGWQEGEIKTVCNQKGEWLVKVKTVNAGGPYTILIASKTEKAELKNILLGEVWICSGQSNMEFPISGYGDTPMNGSNEILMDADNNNIRLFNLKRAVAATPQENCTGNWTIATSENVASFSAIGYLYAKKLQQKLNVPVGIIHASWGGSSIEAWMNKETLYNFPNALSQTTQDITPQHQRASKLYNGMIAPIVNFTIKGTIWYQGESNLRNYKEYAQLMASMVGSWRKDFGVGEFPFYYVQIAPFSYNGFNSALMRDEQLRAMSIIPNSGMVSTIDIGEEKNIHPAEKQTIANRLAYWAFSETYNINGISYKSPTYKSMVVQDSIAIITFENKSIGLSSFGKEVNCFEVAGSDSVFYPAKMNIFQKQVKVWSSKVKVPVAVRYAFCNVPKTTGYLYSIAGLPVPSFRTDKWLK